MVRTWASGSRGLTDQTAEPISANSLVAWAWNACAAGGTPWTPPNA